MLLMPERTIFTLGRLAAKRMAQEGTEAWGAYSLKRDSHRLGHLGQRAALHRLHDDHRFAVFFGHLIALAGLHPFAVPVQIVQLQLDKFHLGVFGQHLVQQIGMVMEGETDMLDQPLFLLLLQPAEAVQLLVDFVMLGAHVVQQVIVKIPRAGLLQLGVEDLVPVLQVVDEACVQLVRQREGIPADDGWSGRS